MKIVLICGFLNKHLLPLSDELSKLGEFYFVSTEQLKEQDNVTQTKNAIFAKYVIEYYKKENILKAQEIILEADIAIFSGSSLDLLMQRKKTGKICFIYTERLFKRSKLRRFIPSTVAVNNIKFKSYSDKTFVLCAGDYVKDDLKLIGFDTTKCYKFGYFPEIGQDDIQYLLSRKTNHPFKLLYVGRLIKLKRVKDVLSCCKLLDRHGIEFELNIIGSGSEEVRLKKFASSLNINVNFLGAKTQEEVFSLMRDSNLLFFASSHFEGWGAVINEAFSFACPVIGSDAVGGVKYLIKENFNGKIYKCGNIKEMCRKTEELLFASNYKTYCVNAYETVKKLWSADVAAKRLIDTYKNINMDDGKKFVEGPLSQA